jgi:hypothetical protein
MGSRERLRIMKKQYLLISAFLSLVLCMPTGGFLLGFVQCKDCGSNPLLWTFIGLIFAVLTPMTLGFPPQNEGGVGPPFNAWPYIAVAAAVIFTVSAALCCLVRVYEDRA